MKVLLINPPFTQYGGEVEIQADEPLGLMYLAAYLRLKGIQVEILDAFQGKKSTAIENDFFKSGLSNQEIKDKIKNIAEKELEEKDIIKHQKELEAMHNYRINELQNILLNHKSMSIPLIAGLLKIKDEEKLTKWLENLPIKFGVKLIKDIDFDSVIITIQDDPKTKYDKINQIINSFSQYFEDQE